MATIDSLDLKATPLTTDVIELGDGNKATLGSLPVSTAQTAAFVGLTGNQTVAGVKTFSSTPAVPGVQLSTTSIPASAVAQIRWNDTDKCPEFETEGGVMVQLGQETLIYARNVSGVSEPNGAVVMLTGSSGQRATVALAQANAVASAQGTIGVVTTSAGIANNAFGFVTTQGLVRELDTSGFTEGAEVWLSAATAGVFTATKPSTEGQYVVRVGFIVRSHATQGMLYVQPLYHGSVTGDAVGSSVSKAAARTAIDAAASDLSNTEAEAVLSEFASRGGLVVGAIGDSITSANGMTTAGRSPSNWFAEFLRASMGRLRFGGVWATGGNTLQQIKDNELPLALAASPRLSACVVFGGTNNMGDADLTAARATLNEIIATLLASRSVPILVCLPPKTNATTDRNNVLAWNNYVRRLAAQNGFPLLDAYTPNLDPATGNQIATTSSDGVHPLASGHLRIGQRAAVDLVGFFPPGSLQWSRGNVDAANLISNPALLTDSNADGLADGWSQITSSGTPTYSLVAGTGLSGDGVMGNWQRVQTSTTSSSLLRHTISTGFSAGDVIEFSGRYRIVTGASNATNFAVEMQTQTGTGSEFIQPLYLLATSSDGVFSRQGTVPVGATSLRINVTVPVASSGTHYLDFSGMTATNLTTGALLGQL